jgi:hypothetical protein
LALLDDEIRELKAKIQHPSGGEKGTTPPKSGGAVSSSHSPTPVIASVATELAVLDRRPATQVRRPATGAETQAWTRKQFARGGSSLRRQGSSKRAKFCGTRQQN